MSRSGVARELDGRAGELGPEHVVRLPPGLEEPEPEAATVEDAEEEGGCACCSS